MKDHMHPEESASAGLTRAQFIKKLIDKAAIAGSLAIAPAVIESFLAPPALAKVSGGPPPPPPR